MGNDNRMRMRQDEASYGRPPADGRPSGDDPLAELARLIGQEDPFAEFFRENEAPQAAPRSPVRAAQPARSEPARQDASRQEPARTDPRPVPARPGAAVEPQRAELRRPDPYRPHETPRPGPFSALAAEVYNEPVPRSRGEHHELEDAARAFNRGVAAEAPSARSAPRPGEGAGSSRTPSDAVAAALGQAPARNVETPVSRAVPRRPEPAPAPVVARSNVPPAPLFEPDADEPPLPRAVRGEPQARGYDADEDTYDYGRTASDHDDEGFDDDDYDYEDEQPTRGRSRLMLIAAAGLGVLVLGAGGYFGWRAISGSGPTSASSQPPVIRADQGPSKVTPAPTATAEQGSDGQKLIYDRVGGEPSGNEQVVSSEEQPVDPAQAAQPQAQPRVILPQSGGSAYPTPSAPASPLGTLPAAGGQAPAPTAATEPKRVRTLTVRADGTIVDGPDAPAPAPAPAIAPQPMGEAQSTLSAYATGSDSAADNVPLPGASMPQTAPLPPSRVAAAEPAAQPDAPSTASAGASGYFVQVAAQRSQAEAQTAWRDMQRRYPGILGSYDANIRRADLGDRGIYFRAQVGPFDSRDQANNLCQSLRAQGGDCMVQRN